MNIQQSLGADIPYLLVGINSFFPFLPPPFSISNNNELFERSPPWCFPRSLANIQHRRQSFEVYPAEKDTYRDVSCTCSTVYTEDYVTQNYSLNSKILTLLLLACKDFEKIMGQWTNFKTISYSNKIWSFTCKL